MADNGWVQQGRLRYSYPPSSGYDTGDPWTMAALCRSPAQHDWPSGMGASHFATQEVGTSETCRRCGATREIAGGSDVIPGTETGQDGSV